MAHCNDKNEVEYYSTVLRDITNDQKISEKLAEAVAATQNSAEKASEFLANMSHEIRTPMNGVIGLTELLRNTDLDEEQKDYVESIQKSGDSLLSIVNDILDFSKLETGKLQFESFEFDLHKTIESTFELFTKQISQKNLELCLNIQKNVPSALIGDPGRLRQVLINFVGNAVKFTEKGEIKINVTAVESGKNPTIHFSIEDTGIGISANSLRNLFTPFTQANSSITRKFGGSGLGLAISKQLITKMNGELGAVSQEGKGSTFWFTATFESQDRSEQRIFSHEKLNNVRLLIVDDNKVQRNNLLSVTKSWGMLVDETDSPESALGLLKKATNNGEIFEVVLIDLNMPKTDGLALSRAIFDDPVLRKTKIVLMPNQLEQVETQQAKDLGINHFVMKPIHQTKLFDTLINIFSNTDIANLDKKDKNPIIPLDSSKIVLNYKGAPTLNLEINRNVRILIAEDNLVNQKVILKQVSGLGYQVDLVENGKQAIEALAKKEYALILMDCQMPIMDGYNATRQIRQDEQKGNKHIPIIAVTAHAIEGDREKCLAVGMDDYISKPTKQQDLAEAISFQLNKSKQKDSPKDFFLQKILPSEPIQNESEVETIESRLVELAETCGRDTVLECITLFLEDSGRIVDSLHKAVSANDLKAVALDAHKLKGSSANMGAVRLPKISQSLITLANNDQDESVSIIFKQIQSEYEFIRSFYSKKLESLKNPVLTANTFH